MSRFQMVLLPDKDPETKSLKQSTLPLTKKLKVEKKPLLGTVLGTRYFVPTRHLNPLQLTSLKKDLTIGGENKGKSAQFKKVEALLAYEQTNEGVFVPRFYGVQKFGPPATCLLTPGVAMQPHLQCTMVPQEQRQQPEALARVKNAFALDYQWGGFLSLPCGYGKTDCAIKLAVDLKRRTLVVVPASPLMKQWMDRIAQRVPGVKIGVLRQDKIEVEGCDFVVAMVHSLAGRDNYPHLDSFGLIILDEAHHMSAPMFSQALLKVPARYLLALSATPRRSTPEETQLLFDFMGPVLFKPQRPPNEQMKIRMLWYNQTPGKEVKTKQNKPLIHVMLKKIVADEWRTQALADFVIEYYQHPKRNILVISKRLAQLENIQKVLLDSGVPSEDVGVLRGSVKEAERQLQQSKRIVLTIEQLGKEGLDATHLNTLIVATPMSGIEQVTGRIQRNVEEQQEWDEKTEYIAPHVVYWVDPYSLYTGMAWKNWKEFKSFGYTVVKEDLDEYQLQHVREISLF